MCMYIRNDRQTDGTNWQTDGQDCTQNHKQTDWLPDGQLDIHTYLHTKVCTYARSHVRTYTHTNKHTYRQTRRDLCTYMHTTYNQLKKQPTDQPTKQTSIHTNIHTQTSPCILIHIQTYSYICMLDLCIPIGLVALGCVLAQMCGSSPSPWKTRF